MGPPPLKAAHCAAFLFLSGTRQIQSYGPTVPSFTARLPDNSREPTFSTESAKNCRTQLNSSQALAQGKLLHLCAVGHRNRRSRWRCDVQPRWQCKCIRRGGRPDAVVAALLTALRARMPFIAVPGPGRRCIFDQMSLGAAQTQIWKAVEQGGLS